MLKTTLLAVLAAAVLPLAPAHATTYDFTGTCGLLTVNDTTPGGLLGGPAENHGVVHLHAVVTADGLPALGYATGWCELRVNSVSQGTVLGPTFGIGVLADAGPLVFTSGPADYVEICTHVAVAGTEIVHCPAISG